MAETFSVRNSPGAIQTYDYQGTADSGVTRVNVGASVDTLTVTNVSGADLWVSVEGGAAAAITSGNSSTTSGTPITYINIYTLGGVAQVRATATLTTPNNNIATPASTAQGQVLIRNASGWDGLAPGTSGQVLQSGGPAANPSWVAPAAGATPAMQRIGVVTPGSPIALVTFSAIPQTFTHLRLVVSGRGDSGNTADVKLVYNSDTAANYENLQVLYVHASPPSTTEQLGIAYARAAVITGSTPPAGAPATSDITIYNYVSTTLFKQAVSHSSPRWGSAASQYFMYQYDSQWRNVAAINRIDVSLSAGNFVPGTVVSLYGLL